MLRIVNRVAVVWTLVCAVAASAQSGGLVVAGGVYEDRLVLAVRPHFLGAEGVTVRLYRDDGDRAPTSADASIATTRTDRAGMYVFRVDRRGDYWVTVDSRSFRADAWPEQTFGPTGSLCAHPDRGTLTTLYEGPCFGGRTVPGSDDASTLTTSEHLALVTVQEQLTSVDFAFSYDAVVTTTDGGAVQGSLRQYFRNANAVKGANRMRFVPLERAPVQRETNFGLPPRWWKITLAEPLPSLVDDDTVVDGTAYNFLSAASAADVHPGRFGEPATLTSGERQISRLRRPELEILSGGSVGIVCEATCGLRGFAIHGASSGIVLRADARIEHVLVGVTADSAPFAGGVIGVQIEKGTTAARHLFVSTQTQNGIRVGSDAKLDGERLEISGIGSPLEGAGILLLSNGSSIRSSSITGNPATGIMIGTAKARAVGNMIDGNVISGNGIGVLLSPDASRNVIMRNDIMWNRFGGVSVLPFETTPPRENRISANRFDENGLRPIILDPAAPEPNVLHPGADSCEPVPALANLGLPAPRVTDVEITDEDGLRVRVRGTGCPGQIVEIYQSFVTSEVRGPSAVTPQVRDESVVTETLTAERRMMVLPSIGEFNYLGATNTRPDGTFEAVFPLPVATSVGETDAVESETDLWAKQVMPVARESDRAFSALAIDPAGNTSEMGVRRRAD